MAFSILGCPHTHLSFPIVTPDTAAGFAARAASDAAPAHVSRPPQPHVTCLDCGREFWYDWQHMRRLAARPQPVYTPRRAA